ncbi:hypothetical protein EGT67_00475 [Prescottella agglutinans]|uniref:ESPR domain-containing protein n=1 Tax=Prescottella agglutinans TaxID=1644129 RepID=A0A438BJC5_9NOCA|nr:hypothetical protein [Prescottella agglutinans]RVW10987.1 hypothetical protein EGT67_00475 [Prescottella agglutinans]
MSRRSLRHAAAATAALALLTAGVTVGLGASVAQAAPACALNQSVTSKWAGSLWTPYTVSKEVVGDGKVAPGQTVTYVTKVSGSGALVNEIRDFHPAGFQLVKARLNVKWLIGDQKWEDVTGTAIVANNSVIVKGGGWTTAGGGVIALETTYKVPDNATVGAQLDSGAGTNIVLAAGNWNINPMGVCVTIRQPNPVEAGSGSLEDLGFGSVNTGSGQVFGSVTDPQGSMTNVVSGILNNVIGNMS